jgi:hypothetical protein
LGFSQIAVTPLKQKRPDWFEAFLFDALYPLRVERVNNRVQIHSALNVFSKFMLERRCGCV